MKRQVSRLLAGFLVSVLCASRASAELIAYEGFNPSGPQQQGDRLGPYDEDDGGGIGWEGVWAYNNGEPGGGEHRFDATTISSDLLKNLPEGFSITHSGWAARDYPGQLTRTIDTSSHGDLVTGSGKFGKDGTTIWVSSLIQFSGRRSCQNNPHEAICLSDGAELKVWTGYRSDDSWQYWQNGDCLLQYAVNGQRFGTGLLGPYSDTVTLEPTMFLIRIDFASGDDTVSVWVDPELTNRSPGTPDHQLTVTDFEFDSIFFQYARGAGSSSLVDEFYIGTSVRDVMTPEPTTIVLIGLCAGLLSLRRIRR